MIAHATKWFGIGVAAAAMSLAGCSSSPDDDNYARNDKREMGDVDRTVAIPTGDRDTSALLVQVDSPSEARVGDALTYQVKVTNVSDMKLQDVRLIESHANHLRLRNAPTTDGRSGAAAWTVGDLNPGQSKVVAIEAEPTQSGMAEVCLAVDYNSYVCLATNVIRPELDVALQGPREVLRCDDLTYTVAVTNTGVGPARNVTLGKDLPNGLKTTDGRRSFNIDIGTLPAGETKKYKIHVSPTRTGEYTYTAQASGAGDLSGQASVTTRVIEPKLSLTANAPAEDYVGVPVRFEYTLRNTGDAPAKNTEVSIDLVDGIEFVNANEGGTLDDDTVVWDLGTIDRGGSRTFAVELRSREKGALRTQAVANAYCASAARATASANIIGIPGLLLEVVDDTDPVRIGDYTTYDITVTNQGSKRATSVRITALLEGNVEFVNASGPTDSRVRGGVVEFAPLSGLNAGDTATWKVTVRGHDPADSRFGVEMTSDLLTRPVRETESTHIYE